MKRLLSILLAALMIFGCVSMAVAEEPVELTFYYPVELGGSQQLLMEDIIADFNAIYPNIKINMVYTGNYANNLTKLQTAIQGGEAPDIWISVYIHKWTFKAMDCIASLNDMVEAMDDGQAYIDNFLAGYIKDSYIDGELISIPFQRSVEVMYYNKDAFAEAGLDPEVAPKTAEDVVAYAEKLIKKDDAGNITRHAIAMAEDPGQFQWVFSPYAYSNSANATNCFSDDGKSVAFNTPENKEILEWWLGLKQAGYAPANITPFSSLATLFLDGSVAMITNSTGNMTYIRNNAEFDVGVAPMPIFDHEATCSGGGNFYVYKGISPEKKDAAWKFLTYCTDPEVQAQWMVDTGYVAVCKSSYETETMAALKAENPYIDTISGLVEIAVGELSTYAYAEITNLLGNYAQGALSGEYEIEEALELLQEEADEVLADYADF